MHNPLRLSLSMLLLLLAGPAAAECPAFHPDPCPADLNCDGSVDGVDLGLVLAASGTGNPGADVNDDGIVDCFDQEAVLAQFDTICPPASADPNQDGFVSDADGDGDVDANDEAVVFHNYCTDCRVDLDKNGSVDEHDVNILICYFGDVDTSSLVADAADFDGSGVVDSYDLSFVLANFGDACKSDLDHNGIVWAADLRLLQLDLEPR